jgi:hypothetical protein
MKPSAPWLTALALSFALGGCTVTTYSNGSGPPPQYSDGSYAPAGWQKLGERMVNRGVDHDTILVGRIDGYFSAIMVRALQSPLELYDLVVTFDDNTTYQPNLRQTFQPGQTSHAIDLPGGRRVIKRVDFRYRDLPGGGRASLELWGRS